jgi:hypothetical protein
MRGWLGRGEDRRFFATVVKTSSTDLREQAAERDVSAKGDRG